MTEFNVSALEAGPAAVVHAEVPVQQLPQVFDRAFHVLMQVVEAQGLTVTGPPFGYYPRMPSATVEVLVGFPVSGPVDPSGEVAGFELPGGPAVTGVHTGPYDGLAATYEELAEWASSEGLQLAGHMWESYLSDPSAVPDPADWKTLISWPLA